jgi:hypothetical protein
MRLAAFAAVLFALGASAPAQAVSETAEGFAAAMQGCWNRVTEAPGAGTGNTVSSQMCLDGGVEGALSVIDCHTHADLTECSTQDGRYGFRDEKFWRAFDGIEDSCDVFLEPSERVTLQNCIWIDPPPGVEPTVDTVYERAIGQ